MEVTAPTRYRFDGVEIDLLRGCVSIGGRELHLRQQALSVLIYLIERRDRLVKKSELFEAVWPGTSVTDDALVQCIKEIRRSLGDETRRPRYVKTVPKVGYRFIGNLEEIPPPVDTAAADSKKGVSPTSLLSVSVFRMLLAGIILLLLTIVGVYLVWAPGSPEENTASSLAGRKTVALLPFENLSSNKEVEWLRKGLPDMLSAGLSDQENLLVINPESIKQISAGSNATDSFFSRPNKANIVISGNFALIGERLRVDVQIHEADGGLMATESIIVEKAERILSEIDLLSLKISKRLGGNREDRPPLESVMTDDLEAYRYYSLAVDKANRLENKDAIELLKHSISIDPDFAMAHARIGYAYSVTWGQPENGKPYLEKAFRLSSRLTEKDRMNIAAWYALANYDFDSAIASYRQIIDRFPFEIEAYWRLARLLAGENKRLEAVEVLRNGINLEPDSKDLYNTLGGILSTLSRHEEAISAHERYVLLAPGEPNAYDSLGLSYQWSGNYEKAIESYSKALELNPNFEIALIHLANTRVRQGKYRAAIQLYERYIAIAPSDAEKGRGFDALAFVYLRRGDLNAADAAARKARSIDPKAIWHSYQIAVSKGRRSEARILEQEFADDIRGSDRGARVNRRLDLYRRGNVALNNRQTEQAIESLKEAIRYGPLGWNYDDYEDCLGRAYLEIGNYHDAIKEFNRVLGISPNYPLAHFFLANAYSAIGQKDAALENYRIFLDLWKDADEDLPELETARKFVRSTSAS